MAPLNQMYSSAVAKSIQHTYLFNSAQPDGSIGKMYYLWIDPQKLNGMGPILYEGRSIQSKIQTFQV